MSAVELNAEQLQMVEIIHNHARRFPCNETGDAQLLQTCYDDMDDICHRYDGFYRFAKLMEMLAWGIADGIVDVPKDH